MAEVSAWRVFKELVDKLQSLGHLPRVPATLMAAVYERHEADPIASYDELGARLAELERVNEELGGDPAQQERLRLLADQLQRGRLSVQIERLQQDSPSAPGAPAREIP